SFIQDPISETIAGVSFVSGTVEGKEVVTAVCGVGKVAAALCTQAMISVYHPDVIINTGVAGTLSNDLSIGSIAVSTAVIQHDVDTSALGDPIGYLSEIKRIEIPADRNVSEHLIACAKVLGIRTVGGIIASGDQFIGSEEKKAFIQEHFNAIACEMEGGAVGQVCYQNRVPFCIMRAISDSADGSSKMDYHAFIEMAATQSVRLLYAYIRA
ncbi:MAG: 5'-methylthioadenosine/adenosylhomocysteine nucleosidase, partial [Clostridia bacterium]|nr:5'-methylthioadenosine/adenosylhomocysteine nucleosidase [Clostridia bacterium]